VIEIVVQNAEVEIVGHGGEDTGSDLKPCR